MLKLIGYRLATLVPLLLAVALCAFVLVRIAPGDYLTEASLNPQISPETIDAMRARYGLDQPWHVQFGRWLGRALSGDLGYSIGCECPVTELLATRVWNTAVLAGAGLGLALAIAFPLGMLSVALGSRAFDRLLSVTVSLLVAWPTFLWALGGVLLAAMTGWFPISRASSLDYDSLSAAGKLADLAHHLALPALVIALKQMPPYLQTLRVSLGEAMAEDYIRAARARGMSEARLLVKHGLGNALNPLMTMFGQSLGALLSGAFVVEAVMSWPGIGSLAVSSLLARELDVLVACLLYAAALLAAGNLLSDLMLAAADPRIRRPQRG